MERKRLTQSHGRELRETALKLIKLSERKVQNLKKLALLGAIREVTNNPDDVKLVLPALKTVRRVGSKFEVRYIKLSSLSIKSPYDIIEKWGLLPRKGLVGGILLKDGTVIDFVEPIPDSEAERWWTK